MLAKRKKNKSGGYSRGVPPLPIPNREVKPRRADGTAPQCGRVGRRLFSTAVFQEKSWETVFFLCIYITFSAFVDSPDKPNWDN